MEKIKASPGKWSLHHGTHDGSVVNRDVEVTEYDSAEEAKAAFARLKVTNEALGLHTWFADLYDDKGNRFVLVKPKQY